MTEQVNTEVDKNHLKVQALTQRIAELVSNYESQLADFRVEHTIAMGDWQNRVQSIQSVLDRTADELASIKADKPVEEPDVPQEDK